MEDARATKPAEHELEFIIPHADTYNIGEASVVHDM